MNLLWRSMGRFGLVFLMIAVQGTLLNVPHMATSAVAPESPFATVVEPIGVAASPGRLLVTQPFCQGEGGPPRQVVSIDSAGRVTAFATLPSEGGCAEDYLAIVPAPPNPESVPGFPTPNPAGFTSNDVYVTQGSTILKIKFDGSSVSPFATIPSCGTSHTGITFDRVGTFGFQLIVVCNTGTVWLFNKNGQTVNPNGSLAESARATIPGDGPFEGPVVAPVSFTPFGGRLLVAAESPGEVFAVSPSGTVQAVHAVPSAEGVTIVPAAKCTFGLSNAATYFTAIFGVGGNTIDSLPISAFTGLDGNALVPSETSTGESPPGITRLAPGSGGVTASTFRAFFAQHEGSAFVDCLTPVLLTIQVIRPRNPGGMISGQHRAWFLHRGGFAFHDTRTHALFAQQGGGEQDDDKSITVIIFPSPNFNPALIIKESVRFGPPTTVGERGSCDLPDRDKEHEKDEDRGKREGAGTARCKFKNNLRPGQLGVLKLKFKDPSQPGDGDAEGGG